MCSDCEAYGLKKHGLTRSDGIVLSVYGIVGSIPGYDTYPSICDLI